MIDVDSMCTQYIKTALWSSIDESREDGGDPLDQNYGPDDLTPEAVATMRLDCEAFARTHEATIDAVMAKDASIDAGRIGHDLWLNRNGHGCGFWDGDYPEPEASLLAAGAEAMGEVHLFVDDNGRIHHDRC